MGKMRIFTAIIAIYTLCCYVKTQITVPDSINLQKSNTPARTPQARTTTALNNLQRGTAGYNEHVEEIASNGISKLAISINNFYLNHRGLDNVIISPVSIAGALALLLLGANGKTFDEIVHVMGLTAGTNINTNSQAVHESLGELFFKLNQSSNLAEQINVAAAIFVQNGYPIRDLYRKTSERVYNNEVLNLDFQGNGVHALQTINTWVSNRTNGKIKSILAEPPPDETKVIITSVLYFNGLWEKQFWEGFTRRRSFYPNGRKTDTNIEVELMSNGGLFPYYRDTELDCDIMGFPYKGNATTMYVIIPQDSNVQKLKSFEASLTSTDIVRLVRSTVYTQSVVLFPKMKIEATTDLREPLQNLGINALFKPQEANLALLSSRHEDGQDNKANRIYDRLINPVPHVSRDSVGREQNDVPIMNKFGSPINCGQMFNSNSNISKCEEIDTNTQRQVTYKKFGDKLGRRVTRDTLDTLDKLRVFLNSDPRNSNVQNPGLYADQVIHKVYIDINERGTEAAASTSVSLTRGGDITIFRADIPFLFFIWHEETKLILFWGTVYEPTPHFS